MSMSEWAKREVELACKRERGNAPEGEWDYGCSCYDSALKAFLSLCEDGHSGMSFGFTRSILIRLMHHRPLTPIEGKDDEWRFSFDNNLGNKVYQNLRLSSLFKEVAPDGTVTYSDNDALYCQDIGNGSTYHSGLVSDIVYQKFPITMPYLPSTEPMVVYTQDCLTDRKNGDFDTMAIFYTEHVGKITEINRFFKESGNSWEEITKEEWEERLKMHHEREQKERESA